MTKHKREDEDEEFWTLIVGDVACVHPGWRRKWTYPPNAEGPTTDLECTRCGGVWRLAICQGVWGNGNSCGSTVKRGEEFCKRHLPTVEKAS